MTAWRITALCKHYVIYIRQVQVNHIELTLEYVKKFFNNGSFVDMKFHILNVHEGVGGHAKIGGVRNLGAETSAKTY